MPKPFEIASSGLVEAQVISQGYEFEADTTALRALAFYLCAPLPDNPRVVTLGASQQIPSKAQSPHELASFEDYVPTADPKHDFIIGVPSGDISEHYFTVQIANELVRRKTHLRHWRLVASGYSLMAAEIAGVAYAIAEHNTPLANTAAGALALTSAAFGLSIHKIGRYTMPDLTEIDPPIRIVSIHADDD